MKLSIFTTSALATGVLAWPKPQLLDLNLGVGAKVTVISTVTVTQPAAACLPASATGNSIGLPSGKPSLPVTGVLPTSVAAPSVAVPSVAKPSVALPSVAVPAIALPSIGLPSIALPAIGLPSIGLPVVGLPSKPTPTQPSSRPVSTSSTTPTPTPQLPSIPSRVTGTAQAYLSAGLSYQAAMLYHHNVARLNHGALPLVWDATCEAAALAAAQTCKSAAYVQGYNTYLSSTSAFNVTAAITESWYKNELSSLTPWFGIASLPVSVLPSISAAAQVVWKGTTKVGCASVDCSGRMTVNGVASSLGKYTVCNYAAAGGVNGLFAVNVGRPVSSVNLGRWTD